MKKNILKVEREFKNSIEAVWKAITVPEQMKNWYEKLGFIKEKCLK